MFITNLVFCGDIFISIEGLKGAATFPAQLQSVLMAALSTLWVGLFPGITSDAVGGAATERLAVGGSAECRHHMTVRGRGTVKNQNGALSRGHF